MLGKAPSSPVKIRSPHRRGNVILLAIFMLSGGIVGALTVALVVVSELRQAKSLDSSFVAHFGAESGLEQSLYEVRKLNYCTGANCSDVNATYVPTALPSGVSTSCDIGTVGCSTQAYERRIAPPPQQHVPSLQENDTFSLDLDPTNPIERLQVMWSPTDPAALPGDLPFMEVSYVVADSLSTQVCRPNFAANFLPYACTLGAGHLDICYAPGAVAPLELDLDGLADTDCTLPNVQQVRFKALNSGIATLTLNVLAPPSAGLSNYIEVKSRRTDGGATQNLQTTIPKQVSAYGFTDYVVFSEQDIIK